MRTFLIAFLIANCLLAVIQISIYLFTQNDSVLLTAIAHSAVITLLLFPIFSREQIKLFEPFTIFFFLVSIGTVGGAYTIGYEFGNSLRRTKMMNGEDIRFFLDAAAFLTGSLFLVGLGYVACRTRIKVENIIPPDSRISRKGMYISSSILLVLSIFCLVLFIQSTGGISLESLSKKRAIEIATDGGVVYGNAGYLRLGASLALIPCYAMISFYYLRDGNIDLRGFLFVGLCLICGALLPFASSSRSGVIYPIFGVILAYTTFRKPSPLSIGLIVGIALIIFGSMTALRTTANSGQRTSFSNPFLSAIQSGNGLSLNGTAIIIDGVPERMPHRLGATFFTWVFAPIPRSFWPEKPDVSLGKEIRREIMNQTVIKTGRPPSFITEGYINFGMAGALICAFLLGYIMKLTKRTFEPLLKTRIFAISIYFPICVNMASMANAALSQFVVRTLSDFLPILIFVAVTRFLSGRSVVRSAEASAH